jgi:signal transduction histidine kinase
MSIAEQTSVDANVRLGFLMHELRNSLSVGIMAVTAVEAGRLSISGATGTVLERSHLAMTKLISISLDDVRTMGIASASGDKFSLSDLVTEAQESAQLNADLLGSTLLVPPVDDLLSLCYNRDLLLAALANLLHNALKFTRARTQVTLTARAAGERIHITVRDHCGGLSIARESVEQDGGEVTRPELPRRWVRLCDQSPTPNCAVMAPPEHHISQDSIL